MQNFTHSSALALPLMGMHPSANGKKINCNARNNNLPLTLQPRSRVFDASAFY